MDTTSAQNSAQPQPSQPQPVIPSIPPVAPQNSSSESKGLLGIGIIVVLLFTTLFALNYVNVLPISDFLPFLPHQTTPIESGATPTQPPQPKIVTAPQKTLSAGFDASLQNGPYKCPMLLVHCQNIKDPADSVSAKTISKLPLYAVFDGTAEALPSSHPNVDGTNEQFNLILLTNEPRGLQGMYYYKGEVFPKRTVKAGEQLIDTNGEVLEFMDKAAAVFKLMKLTTTGSEVVKLSAIDFTR